MATSQVSICNSALIKLGSHQRITSLTQANSPLAALCNEQYAKIRDDLLRSHIWNFAGLWSKLVTTGTTPTAEYEYEFTMPNDWIRVIKVSDNDAGVGDLPYDLYNDKLYCDSNTVYLKYISKVTDPNLFPADFREALAYLLAVDICFAVTDAKTKRDALEPSARRAVARAKSADSQENYPEQMPVGSWVTSRSGSQSGIWGHGST